MTDGWICGQIRETAQTTAPDLRAEVRIAVSFFSAVLSRRPWCGEASQGLLSLAGLATLHKQSEPEAAPPHPLLRLSQSRSGGVVGALPAAG